MDAATWKRQRAAFEGALPLAPAERVRFLERACGEDGGLRARVEELLRARELVTLYGHSARVDRLAFARDGSSLASVDLDGVIKLWEAPASTGR